MEQYREVDNEGKLGRLGVPKKAADGNAKYANRKGHRRLVSFVPSSKSRSSSRDLGRFRVAATFCAMQPGCDDEKDAGAERSRDATSKPQWPPAGHGPVLKIRISSRHLIDWLWLPMTTWPLLVPFKKVTLLHSPTPSTLL
jgi:hypothetical protein